MITVKGYKASNPYSNHGTKLDVYHVCVPNSEMQVCLGADEVKDLIKKVMKFAKQDVRFIDLTTGIEVINRVRSSRKLMKAVEDMQAFFG